MIERDVNHGLWWPLWRGELTDKHQDRRRSRRNQKRPKEKHSPVYFWDVVGLRLKLAHNVFPRKGTRAVQFEAASGIAQNDELAHDRQPGVLSAR
jgi:hypothetical protein